MDNQQEPKPGLAQQMGFGKVPFIDMADSPEDERIKAIGDKASLGAVVGFVVDDEPPKIARYVAKLRARYPMLRIALVGRDPETPGCFWLKAEPTQQ